MDTNIKDYKIIKQLGKGAYGITYLTESVDNKMYALKLIELNCNDK